MINILIPWTIYIYIKKKKFALEKRLKVVKGNDLSAPIWSAGVCVVPNIMMPKKFRISDSSSIPN